LQKDRATILNSTTFNERRC